MGSTSASYYAFEASKDTAASGAFLKVGRTGSVLPTKAEAANAFDKLMASKPGSATTAFAFRATPVMSFGVLNPKERHGPDRNASRLNVSLLNSALCENIARLRISQA